MRTLAIDTSRFPGSVALLDGDRCDAQPLPDSGKTAETLFTTLERLLAQRQWRPSDVELVAVTTGPGSFTGLRIGVTFAKTWAYARGCAVIGIETSDVLAAQADVPAERLDVLLDAERRQLFVTRYILRDSPTDDPLARWQRAGSTEILDRAAWRDAFVPGTAVIGDGLRGIDPLPEGAIVVDSSRWAVRAETLGRLAERAYQRGERCDPLRLVPQYYRASAAEEKRKA